MSDSCLFFHLKISRSSEGLRYDRLRVQMKNSFMSSGLYGCESPGHESRESEHKPRICKMAPQSRAKQNLLWRGLKAWSQSPESAVSGGKASHQQKPKALHCVTFVGRISRYRAARDRLYILGCPTFPVSHFLTCGSVWTLSSGKCRSILER